MRFSVVELKVSIILPTYNEKENIKAIIPKIFEVFEKNRIDGDVIVVDDNSPDGTAEEVKKLQTIYSIDLIEREKKMGIGSAYITGFKRAMKNNSDIVFEMDADLSHNPEYIPEFIGQMDRFDLVIGSRKIEGGKVIGWDFYRKSVSGGGNWIGRWVSGIDVSDLTSGYRAYKRDVIQSIDVDKIQSSGYAFQLEILARCLKKGFKVGATPIVFVDRGAGKSKLSKKELINFFLTATKIRLGMIK